jgi:hypothetical protein
VEPGGDEDGLRECSPCVRTSFNDWNAFKIVEFDF